MKHFLCVLLLAAAPSLLLAAEPKQPCRTLVIGPRQWLSSDFAPFLEAMIEHSHLNWDVQPNDDLRMLADLGLRPSGYK